MHSSRKLAEYIFFFGLLILATYLVWLVIAPFGTVLALAAMIVTVCYPIHERMIRIAPRKNRSFAALISTLIVIVIVVVPIIILGSYVFREAISVYTLYSSNDHAELAGIIVNIEHVAQRFAPGFKIDIQNVVGQAANFVATHLVAIFTTTASTLFLSFITLISIFYLFRDGKEFTAFITHISPLKNDRDARILSRIATAVRSVALGSIFVSIVQGTMTAIGLSFFGFDRAILLGCIAALGSLMPGVGTAIVYIPAVLFLLVTGQNMTATGVALWGVLAVGLIDNFLGPYVMSKTNTLHPFLILLSVLGGIAFIGPVGFILGPVIMSFFAVLIELYADDLVGKQE